MSRKRLIELQGINDIIVRENIMLNEEVIRQRCCIRSMENQVKELQDVVIDIKKYQSTYENKVTNLK